MRRVLFNKDVYRLITNPKFHQIDYPKWMLSEMYKEYSKDGTTDIISPF